MQDTEMGGSFGLIIMRKAVNGVTDVAAQPGKKL